MEKQKQKKGTMKEKNRCLKKKENFANKKALALFEKELWKRVKQAIMYRVWYNLTIDSPSQLVTA